MTSVITMSGEYVRPKPSIDTTLSEIPVGHFRVRIIGFIVSKTPSSIVINDGTGQATIFISKFETSEFEIQQLGRFVLDINKTENESKGELIAFHKMSKDQVDQYQKLVKLERKIQY